MLMYTTEKKHPTQESAAAASIEAVDVDYMVLFQEDVYLHS